MADLETTSGCEGRAAWFGKRPSVTLPAWDDGFLRACQSAGSIVDCHPADRSSLAAWGHLIGWALIGCAAIGVAWLFFLR